VAAAGGSSPADLVDGVNQLAWVRLGKIRSNQHHKIPATLAEVPKTIYFCEVLAARPYLWSLLYSNQL